MNDSLPLVEIYSKENCHLCEDVKKIIKKVNSIKEFTFKEIDITQDPDIFEKFKYDIPVVHINGKIAFKYRIDENEFIHKLEKRKL